MSADRSHTGVTAPRQQTPRFRIWPPVAIAVPWLLGVAGGRAFDLPVVTGDLVTASGWLLIGVFAVWNGWCLVLFARRRTGLLPGQSTTALLSRGPYRYSRNPLYLGLLVLYVGTALLAYSPGALALLPLAWAGLLWGAILPEERYLRAALGDPYEAYCRQVRRWI